MQKRISLFVSIVVLACMFFSVRSGYSEELSELGEIVVTATRVEEQKKDLPVSVQVITEEDIKNSTAQNAGDLLAEAGLGHVQKYPGAMTAKVGLRGYSTDLFSIYKSRVLVLINGHYAGTVNLAKIPVEDIERVEIVKGPGSVVYGSQAMGGVINIITKRAKRYGLHGAIGGAAGSWNYWKALAEAGYRQGPVDLYMTASKSSRDNFETVDYGEIENTEYNDETFSFRAGYSFGQDHRISAGFQHWRGWDIGMPGAVYSPDPDDFTNKRRDAFDLNYTLRNLKISYYFIKDRDESHDSGMTPGPGNSEITVNKTTTTGGTVQNTFELRPVRLTAGVDYNTIKVESSRNTGAPYSPNSKYTNYGVFTEARTGFFDGRLIINLGLRYDYLKNEILPTAGLTVAPRQEDIDHLTVRGGLVYALTESLRLRTNVGTAFRAPAPDELAADYVSSWGTHYVGNPGLDPEKSTTYEAGVLYKRGYFKGEFTFFHSRFKDKILNYYDATLNAMTWKNVDGATLQGWETSFAYNIGGALNLDISLEPFMNVTYHTKYVAEDEDEVSQYGKTLLYTPKWTGAFGIRAMGQRWDMRVIANYTGNERVMDWDFTSATYGQVIEKGDFTVVHLKGSYRPHRNIEITASVENLFNRAYEYVKGYPMPKRTYTAGLRFRF